MQRTRPDAAATELTALRSLTREELTRTLYDLDAIDLAGLFSRIGDEALAELLAELDPTDAARLIGKLSRAQAAKILEEMEPDDAVDVVGELEEEEAEAILTAMTPSEAEDLRELLEYPPDSAGGIMTPDFVALSPYITAGQALGILRNSAEQFQQVPYFYVVEPGTKKLLGVLSLRHLILAPASTRVSELVVRDTVRVNAAADQEEAARLIDQRRLQALPVVDDEDRLLGIITADDAADVLLEEAHEDIDRLGGQQPLDEPYLRTSILYLFRKRIVWLLVLFAAEAYTSTVLQYFEDTLAERITLGLFIPLLIGTGGNTGSQITTTLVRSLSTGDVSPRDILRVIRKELGVALLVGVVMGSVTILRALMLGVGVDVGRVVAVATLAIVLWAAFVSAILPLVLRRIKLDPAVISTPLITTLVDGTGLFIYFTVARILLHLD